jgi:hypothetical protein
MKIIKIMNKTNNSLSARYGYEDDSIKVELQKEKVATGCYVWAIYVEDYETKESYVEHNYSYKDAKKYASGLINK